jgi:hypothetical protein
MVSAVAGSSARDLVLSSSSLAIIVMAQRQMPTRASAAARSII